MKSRDETPTLLQVKNWVFPFGKYKDQKIIDVWQVDKKYCEWVYNTFDDDNQTKLAVKLLCPGVGESTEHNIDTAKILDLQSRKKK